MPSKCAWAPTRSTSWSTALWCIRSRRAERWPRPTASTASASTTCSKFRWTDWECRRTERDGRPELFVPKRPDRGNAGGAVGGDETRQGAGGGQDQDSGGDRDSVVGFHTEEHAGDVAAEKKRRGNAGGQATGDHQEGFAQHHPQHLRAARAQGDADADFAGAARHRIGQRSVHADRDQQKRQQSEEAGDTGEHVFVGEGFVDELQKDSNAANRTAESKKADKTAPDEQKDSTAAKKPS